MTKELTMVNFRIPESDEKLPTKIVKDGHGQEIVIADLDDPFYGPKTGYIKIEALKKNSKVDPNTIIRRVNDRKTGVTFGIPNGIDPDSKEIRWLPIQLRGAVVLDLSIPKERQKAIIIMNSFLVEGSRNQAGKPEFKVISAEQQAATYLKKFKQKKAALQYAESLSHDEIFDFAHAIGINPDGNSLAMLMEAVYKYAENNPERFINIYNDPNRNAIVIFKKAEANGVVKFTPTSGYEFSHENNNYPLGLTEQNAVQTLIKNQPLLFGIKKLLDEGLPNNPSGSHVNAAKEISEIDKLKAELAELKAKQNGAKDKKDVAVSKEAEPIVTNDPPEYDVYLGDEPVVDEEKEEPALSLDELKVLARSAGIKGYHLMNRETLERKLEAQKSS